METAICSREKREANLAGNGRLSYAFADAAAQIGAENLSVITVT